MSIAILVFNPCNQHYYKPDSYILDPYWLPSSLYPMIVCNGGHLSFCTHMTQFLSSNHIHLVLEWKISTRAQTLYNWGQSWIFLWILSPLHTIWSNIPPTFCHLFSEWTLKLHLNRMDNTTMATIHDHSKASVQSAIGHTSIRNRKTGVFLYITFPWNGMNFVLKDYYSWVMWHLHLLALSHPLPHSIPWQTLSALLILLLIALYHFLQHRPTTIPIKRCGFRATMGKTTVLNP